MAFYNVTYNKKHDFATVHNYGCTFRCPICSYKLRSGPNGTPGLAYPRPDKYLKAEDIENVLLTISPSRVNFMGGEPTVSKDLPRLLAFCKERLGAVTALGHTNGSNLSLPNIDVANVGLKAWEEECHLKLTGIEKSKIYGEVKSAVERGMDVATNMIYIPGFVETDQIEAATEYLSSIGISKFHIMGYIPVPGQPYRRPTVNEMEAACRAARQYIPDTFYSHLTPEEVISLDRNDDRFDIEVVLGTDKTRGVITTKGENAIGYTVTN